MFDPLSALVQGEPFSPAHERITGTDNLKDGGSCGLSSGTGAGNALTVQQIPIQP